jgi:hypothetical protein
MASPSSNPKNEEPQPHASFGDLSGVADKDSDSQKEQNLAPEILKETNDNELAPPSATPESNDGTAGPHLEQNL